MEPFLLITVSFCLLPRRFTTDKEWKMMNSVEVCSDLKAVFVGDSDGCVHVLVRIGVRLLM